MRVRDYPVTLTIAGSDSGGEAGLQRDLRTFAQLKVRGACAVTCLTAQNRAAVIRLEPVSPRMVRAQMEAVAAEAPIAAAKTGMLYSAAIVREVAAFFKNARRIPLVVDPVLISTSGRRLLETSALRVLERDLLPLATLATPNVPETEAILGLRITNPESARRAARAWNECFGSAALIKGGHLPASGSAADFLCAAEGEWLLESTRVAGVKLHGTGCAYSAAITAFLAHRKSLVQSVFLAKTFITRQILSYRLSA